MSEGEVMELVGILSVAIGPICLILWRVGMWGFQRLLATQHDIVAHLEQVNSRLDAHDREFEYLRGVTDTLNQIVQRRKE